ncbi:TPM domain-containing protein [Pseudoxanthomonas daejeonensis]|uniref:TPM domain-containing protein n=1 Tax=Pseudoxanthomonas daejeonensis TaxID=266062 RepID=UPI001F53F1C5|nr:TPM domain-containing protein [Pseudoxanthomonas daejeonensis]UNK58134.1 TPM domain-containing protein [Pseudoxanthomonas daejeonensis]
MRWLRHLFAPSAARQFPAARLERIATAIAAGERLHDGEVVFAVEAGLPWRALVDGMAPRERAHEVFARLRVWDTGSNNGVLLYLLLADHAIEIVADRGLHDRVADAEWEAVCHALEQAMAGGEALESAVVAGIERISILLARHYPATGASRDELPDRPVLL